MRKKTNKVLAVALCATALSAFYGSPVMAGPASKDPIHTESTVWADGGLTVGRDGNGMLHVKNNGNITISNENHKNTFTVNSLTGDVTAGKINGVDIRSSLAGDAIINGNVIGFDGINTTGDLQVGLGDKFHVDANTGDVKAGKINGATITKDSFNGATITANSFNGVEVNKLGYIHTKGKMWADAGLTVGRDGKGMLHVKDNGNITISNENRENTFAVDANTGNVTAGKINGVNISSSLAGDAIINGNVIGFDGIIATGDLQVGLGDKFHVDANTGDVKAGKINGATITENGFNGVTIDKDGNVITASNMSAGKVYTNELHAETVNEAVITKDAFNGATITENSFNGVTIDKGGNVITAGNMSAEQVHTNELHAGTVNGAVITEDTFNGALINEEGVNGVQLKDGKVSAESVWTNALTAGTVNGAVITEDTFNGVNIGDLVNNVGQVNENVAGIKRENGVTIIEDTLYVSKEATAVNGVKLQNGEVSAESVWTNALTAGTVNGAKITEDTFNGALINEEGVNGVQLKDGKVSAESVWTNALTAGTVNGAVITEDTFNGVNIGDLATNVGQVNENVAGIKRENGVTTIEGALKVSEDEFTVGYGEHNMAINANGTVFNGSVNLGNNASFVHGKDTVSLNGFYDEFKEHLNASNETNKGFAEAIEKLENKTQHITADENGTTFEGNVNVNGNVTAENITAGGVNAEGGNITAGNVTADKGVIGGVTMEGGSVTADKGNIGGVTMEGGNVTAGNVTVGNTVVNDKDVVINKGQDNEVSLSGTANRVDSLEKDFNKSVNGLNNRINQVDDKINKVGAMAAAIANLRTMGYDPTAPTEIAVGVGQYRDETGAALGFFHYPNKNFMLSLSVSTSGEEVMGGIGATWKFGRKNAENDAQHEQARVERAKLAKAEDIKKAARDAKVAEQQKRHAQMLAAQAE